MIPVGCTFPFLTIRSVPSFFDDHDGVTPFPSLRISTYYVCTMTHVIAGIVCIVAKLTKNIILTVSYLATPQWG
jgi:hypothetical protein